MRLSSAVFPWQSVFFPIFLVALGFWFVVALVRAIFAQNKELNRMSETKLASSSSRYPRGQLFIIDRIVCCFSYFVLCCFFSFYFLAIDGFVMRLIATSGATSIAFIHYYFLSSSMLFNVHSVSSFAAAQWILVHCVHTHNFQIEYYYYVCWTASCCLVFACSIYSICLYVYRCERVKSYRM